MRKRINIYGDLFKTSNTNNALSLFQKKFKNPEYIQNLTITETIHFNKHVDDCIYIIDHNVHIITPNQNK